jgi:hypothetical protein
MYRQSPNWDDMTLLEMRNAEVIFEVLEDCKPSLWEHEYENSALTLEIKKGLAVFILRYPVSSFEEAASRTQEFLGSWEADIILQSGKVRRVFRLQSVRVPGFGGAAFFQIHGACGGPQAEANTVQQAPWRRHRYYGDPVLHSLVERYQDFRRGREKVTVLGWMCLTALKALCRNSGGVEVHCNVSRNVVTTLGRLVSSLGTYRSARKIAGEQHQLRELTDQEAFWIEVTVRELLRRAGAGDVQPTLTLEELPPLRALVTYKASEESTALKTIIGGRDRQELERERQENDA